MSIFTDLGIQPRTISYRVLHQITAAADPKEFRKLLEESLQQTRADASSIRDALYASLNEARARAAQVAKGGLNQYLSTPIKSDNEDVERIIKDALEKHLERILPTAKFGIESAWCSSLIEDGSIVTSQTKISGIVRSMLSAGKRALKDIGFVRGKNSPNIYETVYLVESGMNLDALEFLLRKDSFHDTFLQTIQRGWNGIYNVIVNTTGSEQTKNLWEASMTWDNSGMTGQDFAAGIERIFTQLSKEFNLHQLSLWERKFSFARNNEFTVHIRMIPDQKLFFEVIKFLVSSSNEPAGKSLVENGALIVKEIIS